MTVFDTVTGVIWLVMIVYAFLMRTGGGSEAPTRGAEQQDTSATPQSLAAYRQATESFRALAGLRFAYLVLLALLTFGFDAVFLAARLGPYQHSMLATVAMASTASMLVIQERIFDSWKHARQASSSLETAWGLSVPKTLEPPIAQGSTAESPVDAGRGLSRLRPATRLRRNSLIALLAVLG